MWFHPEFVIVALILAAALFASRRVRRMHTPNGYRGVRYGIGQFGTPIEVNRPSHACRGCGRIIEPEWEVCPHCHKPTH